MEHGLLVRNLDALQARFGRRPDAESDSGRIRLEPGTLHPTLFVRSGAGAWVSLHGSRDPLREATGQLDTALAGRPLPPVVVIIGAGLGYLIDVVETRNGSTRVLCVEPDAAAVRAALERRDWSGPIASGRLTLVWGPEFVGAVDAWRLLEELDPGEEPLTLINPALTRAWPEAVDATRACLARIVHAQRANALARRRFAGPYLLNTIANLPVILGSGDVADLTGLFPSTAAVLVAAGPSLDTNLPEIWAARDRALIIATDTALRPLLDGGIEPHLVVAVDPGEANARHLTALPPCPGTTLVAEGSVHPSAFDHFAGRVAVFQVSDHHPWPWLRTCGVTRGTLAAWGSVLTSTFDLAVRMGCDPIVFTGADLAFTGGRPYCRGTVYEEDWTRRRLNGESLEGIWAQIVAERSPIESPGIAGAPVLTTADFLAFRDWLLERMRTPSRRFVNATGAGTLMGDSVVQMALSDALGPLGAPTGDARAILARARAIAPERTPSVIPSLKDPAALRGDIVTEWRRFTCDTVSESEIRLAFDKAFAPSRPDRGVEDEPVVWSPPGEWATMRAPGRREALRRFVGGPSAGPRPAAGFDPASPTDEGALGASMAALKWFSARARSLVRKPRIPRLPAHLPAAGLLPSDCFVVKPEAAAAVALFESALGTMLLGAGEPPALAPGAYYSDELVALERARVLEVDGGRDRGHTSADDRAVLMALAQWTAVCRAVGHLDRGAFGAWFEVCLRALAAGEMPLPGSSAASPGAIQVRLALRLVTPAGPARWSCRQPLELPFPARLLTGVVLTPGRKPSGAPATSGASFGLPLRRSRGWALTRRSPAADPELGAVAVAVRLRVMPPSAGGASACHPLANRPGEPARWIEPILLTHAGLPRGSFASTFDEGHAIVTPSSGRASCLVRADGTFVSQTPWPHPITCEQRSADGDHAVAWLHGRESVLSVRPAAGGAAKTRRLPFLPTAVLEDAGGRFLCSSTSGLWVVGIREGDDRRVADLGPCVLVCRSDRLIRVDPVAMRDGALVRERLDRAWMFDPRGETVEPMALGAEGQSWAATAGAGWLAQTFPDADLVRLTDPGGRMVDLVVAYPRSVAWAGSSLVVATTYGDVLLFPGVAARSL